MTYALAYLVLLAMILAFVGGASVASERMDGSARAGARSPACIGAIREDAR